VVKERTVRAAIASGADSIEEVGRRCGAGTVCGGCHELIDELLAQAVVVRGAHSGHSAA
jgi:bacterioferritin-associated ferredoxin